MLGMLFVALWAHTSVVTTTGDTYLMLLVKPIYHANVLEIVFVTTPR